MGVMTIGALNESLFHAMVERHVELCLSLQMAAIAKGWLGFDQLKLICNSLVGRMTTQAAQVVLAVCRARKVHMVFPGAVACQTTLVDLLCRRGLEAENLFGIGIFRMSAARPVAGFATMSFGSALGLQDAVPMACLLQPLVDVFVTGFAGICSHILRCSEILPRCVLRRLIRRRGACACTGNGKKE